MLRLRPPPRRKPHRHRSPRQSPAVSAALLPRLPRPFLRTQGHPAVPGPFARGQGALDLGTRQRGLWCPQNGAPGQGPSRYRQPLQPRRRRTLPRRAPRTGGPLARDPRDPDGREGVGRRQQGKELRRGRPRGPVPGGLLGPRGLRPGAPARRVGDPRGADGGAGRRGGGGRPGGAGGAAEELVADGEERWGDRTPGLITTDEYAPYEGAILEAFGTEVVPPRTGKPGRPRKPYKVAPTGRQYSTE